MDEEDRTAVAAARERLRGFAIHLLAYFVVMAGLVVVNVMQNPDVAWSLYPVVAWGTALALHAAYVMGLFNGLLGASKD